VAVDASDRVFVADGQGGRIVVLDGKVGDANFGHCIFSWFTGSTDPTKPASHSDPYGVAVDKSGHVFVADVGTASVFEYNVPANSPPTTATQLSWTFQAPVAVCVDPSGNVFVSDEKARQVIVFKGSMLTGSVFTSFIENDHFAIAADDKSVFVSFRKLTTPMVLQFDKTGKPIQKCCDVDIAHGMLTKPEGLAIDGAGHLFVSDTGAGNVKVFLPYRTPCPLYCVTFGSGLFNGPGRSPTVTPQPFGLAIDGGGNIFVADPVQDDKGTSVVRFFTPLVDCPMCKESKPKIQAGAPAHSH
jgi:sugar lactone lactonase YvrE